MNPYRRVLFGTVLGIAAVGHGWMLWASDPVVRWRLILLAGVFAAGTAATYWHYRERLTPNLVTANLALGALVHLAVAAALVGIERLWALGVVPALQSNWHHFAIGAAGLFAAFVAWTRARPGARVAPVRPVEAEPEPPPPATARTESPPDWEGLAATLAERGDGVRTRQLAVFQRFAAALDDGGEAARRVVHQEARRLLTESDAEQRGAEADDVLTAAASLLEWGTQKLPELAELDVSDVLMAKAVADIRAQHSAVEHRFVDHRNLLAIHPIDRQTADDKCNTRAEAARAAEAVIEANGWRLSEELIAAEPALEPFRSVTGFQVIAIDPDRYVTFEGNGRREALARAFPDRGILVEVRVFCFEDPRAAQAMIRRVERVRRWKKVRDR